MFEQTEILDVRPRRGSLFGCRVADARRRVSMSQAVLAAAVGVERTTITNIERGKALPSLPTFVSICTALKVTPNDLIWEKPATTGEG